MTSPDSKRVSDSSTRTPLVAVGVIIGAHGIRGQVKIRSFTDNPEDILAYGALLNKEGTRRFEVRIEGETKGGIIASLKGVTDRNVAEQMRGTELFVDRNNIPEADEDEFAYDELIGLNASSADGTLIGKITAVLNFGANDVIEIRMAATGKKELLPFTKVVFPEIDVKAGKVIVDMPEMIEAPKRTKEDSDDSV